MSKDYSHIIRPGCTEIMTALNEKSIVPIFPKWFTPFRKKVRTCCFQLSVTASRYFIVQNALRRFRLLLSLEQERKVVSLKSPFSQRKN